MKTKIDLNELFDAEDVNLNGSTDPATNKDSPESEHDETHLVEAAARVLEAAERSCREKRRGYCSVYGGVREVLRGVAPPRGDGPEDGEVAGAPPLDEE
jgi:hypothetical protein